MQRKPYNYSYFEIFICIFSVRGDIEGFWCLPCGMESSELFGDNNQKAARDSIPHGKHLERGC